VVGGKIARRYSIISQNSIKTPAAPKKKMKMKMKTEMKLVGRAVTLSFSRWLSASVLNWANRTFFVHLEDWSTMEGPVVFIDSFCTASSRKVTRFSIV